MSNKPSKPTLREAARQALEALELARGSHGVMLMSNPPRDAWQYRGCDSKLAEAITALREALEVTEATISDHKSEQVMVSIDFMRRSHPSKE